MTKLAIIGGSGVYNFEDIKVIDEFEIETPFGKPSSNIVKASIDENEFFFLPRHGKGHKISPSEINYRANIFALKTLGADIIVSLRVVSDVGNPNYAFGTSGFETWSGYPCLQVFQSA